MSNVVPLPRPSDRHPSGRRITSGSCRWITPAPGYDEDMAALQRSDRFAWNGLIDQIDASMEPLGLGGSIYEQPGDYQSPLIFAPKSVVDPPWIGELKVLGTAPKVLRRPTPMWRLYFGEPLEVRRGIIAVCLRRKVNGQQQRGHVVEAMQLLKVHFGNLGHSWAPFQARR